MKKLLSLLTLFAGILAPISAFAACSTPTADAGATFYNTSVNAVQFCDGDDWYNAGLVVSGATGTSCTTPTGPEGGMFYNTSQNTVQFCNGDDWVNMGTMNFPSATGTSCTTPTGPEGGMFFNTTTKTMQFCNGDDWVNATYLIIAANAITGVELTKIQASDAEVDDWFGKSVSIDGDYAIVGAYGEDAGGATAGAAYIFKYSGTDWTQEFKLVANDPDGNDYFGNTVSISGDYALVGSHGEDAGGANAGAAYIFKRTGTTWNQEAKLASLDLEAGDQFGISTSIDGDYAIVGARYEGAGGSNAGAAYIFKRTGSTWAQESKLVASDPQVDDVFGFSVDLNGDYAIVGAYGEDTGGLSAGAAYIFKRSGVVWTQQEKIVALDAGATDTFSHSVGITDDYAIVGAYAEDTGGVNAGAAYVFKRSGEDWTQSSKLVASDPHVSDYFGITVAIYGEHIVIGAQQEGTGGSNSGAAYVFKRAGTNWSQTHKLKASDAAIDDYFGGAVAIDSGKIFVGAKNEDTGGSATGTVYIFD